MQLSLTSALAKVGVEGSNPFARSKIRDTQEPRETAAFAF